VRDGTAAARQRLYAEATALVAGSYREKLTLRALATALASSPRQIQRAYADFGGTSFREDLRLRRLQAAAELLAAQPSIAVGEVGRLVGYRHPAQFARVFGACHGLTPGEFRAHARAPGPGARAAGGGRWTGQVRRAPEVGELASAAAGGDSSSRSSGAGSRPGSRSRISVPPPAAGSALIAPPS
jgi:AraC-like DNA-binding protein